MSMRQKWNKNWMEWKLSFLACNLYIVINLLHGGGISYTLPNTPRIIQLVARRLTAKGAAVVEKVKVKAQEY